MGSPTNIRRDGHWAILEGRTAFGDQSAVTAPKVNTDGVRHTNVGMVRGNLTQTFGITTAGELRAYGVAFEPQTEAYAVYRVRGFQHLQNPGGSERTMLGSMLSGSYSSGHENGLDLSWHKANVSHIEFDETLVLKQHSTLSANPVVIFIAVYAMSAVSSFAHYLAGELSVQKLTIPAPEMELAVT